MTEVDILILGAGCAGTSLAYYLEQEGYGGNVALIDNRTSFDQEQRWCSWAELPHALLSLVEHSWQKWAINDKNCSLVRGSEKFAYRQIYAPHFFQKFHSRWQNGSTATNLHLGEVVQKVEPQDDSVGVTTNIRQWRARLVFDARRQNVLIQNRRKNSSVYLHQTFLGWTVKYARSVFDPDTAILMDFRTEKTSCVNFIYVLPYSETEALVESTAFSLFPASWERHLQAVAKYLQQNFGEDYKIKSQESGDLPMTVAPLPTQFHPKIGAIGVAGGCTRASSGYAFHRIQRQTNNIARALVRHEPFSTTVAANKYSFLDAIFLESLVRHPAAAHKIFAALFERVPPDSLIRFLLDESSWKDDLAIVRALPKLQFGITGINYLQRKLWEYHERKQAENNSSLHDPVGDSALRICAKNFGR